MVHAKYTNHNDPIYYDNDVEFFIAGRDAYYEFEINAFNTSYEVFFIWNDAYEKGGFTRAPEKSFASLLTDRASRVQIPFPDDEGQPGHLAPSPTESGTVPVRDRRAGRLQSAIPSASGPGYLHLRLDPASRPGAAQGRRARATGLLPPVRPPLRHVQ